MLKKKRVMFFKFLFALAFFRWIRLNIELSGTYVLQKITFHFGFETDYQR